MVWKSGTQLKNGRYVIQTVLGQGGFGITYRVRHVQHNQTVVIKTPNEYLKHDPKYDKYVERFIKEARMLERFSQDTHTNIVRVRDLFQEGETYCLVMDFVAGENLFQVVKRRGSLPEAEAINCIRQIGEALTVVHQAGLTHRDAHPGNIILQNNRAVLIDFGIAKELIPTTLSSTGNAGNYGFAPYEQLVGGSREPSVDIYCLAATLYLVVTRQHPTTSLDRKLNYAPLIEPKRINREISDRLNEAILRGMALEASDRPSSMASWLELLDPPPLPSPKPVPQKTTEPEQSQPRPSIEISWHWLIPYLILYIFTGLLSARVSASSRDWAWTVGGAGVLAGVLALRLLKAKNDAEAWDDDAEAWDDDTEAWDDNWNLDRTWSVMGLVVACGLAWHLAGISAGIFSGVGFSVGAFLVWIRARGRERLLDSFTEMHTCPTLATFFVLGTTSTIGLCLGALMYWGANQR